MYDRASIKESAKAALRQSWGISIGVLVLYCALLSVVTAATFGFGELFLAPPLLVGICLFFIGVWRQQSPQFESLFSGFAHYTQCLVGILWMYMWTFLWSMLFVIPGIIKSYAYAMTPYLLADYPNLDPRKALRVSMAITQGRKMEIFIMQLSFFGWLMLSAFTAGILYIVYVGPYMQTALAGQYEGLLRDALEDGKITEADLI